MKPASFAYHRPASLADAIGLLARLGEDAKPLAGGQSLVPMMNLRLAQPAHLVDLGALAALRGIRDDADALVIGAATTHHELATSPLVRARCPLAAAAAGTIAHYAIRQRGTIGGSLAHADPAAQWPLVAVALDALIEVAGPDGTRTIPAQSFFVAIMTTALAPGELITAVRLPAMRADAGWSFRTASRRHGDFAMASVACVVEMRAGVLAWAHLAASGAGPIPRRFDDLIAIHRGQPLDDAAIASIAAEVARQAEPEPHHAVPPEYRRELLAELVRGALVEARERAA